MNEKLRRWLEGYCWEQPDGTWLVHAAAIVWSPAPSVILPDASLKEAYIGQAVRLGRFQLASDFVQTNTMFLFLLWINRSSILMQDLRISLALATAPAFVMLVVNFGLHYGLIPRMERRLRARLQQTGKGAFPDAARLGQEQKAPWWFGGRPGLKRCRPGWMVVAEAIVMCAAASAIALGSVRYGYDFRQAQNAWWTAGEPWSAFPRECIGVLSLFWLLSAIVILMLMAHTVWDWCRWNGRRA